MINLLPPEEKEILRQEETRRLILILGFLILAFLLCLSLILFSVKTYISSQAAFQRTLFANTQEELQSSGAQALKTEIDSINQELLAMDAFYQRQTDLVELSEEIIDVLPDGMYLTHLRFISLPSEEGYVCQISLSGYAPNRDILLGYKGKLEEKEELAEFYFPPKNIIKRTDIDFNLSFKFIQ